MSKKPIFNLKFIMGLPKQELQLINELNEFYDKGREHGHVNVFQRNKVEFTRRYWSVKSLEGKGIIEFQGELKMNIRSYKFTKEFLEWKRK